LHSARLSAQAVEIDKAGESAPVAGPHIQLAIGASVRLEVLREIPEDLNLRQQWNRLALAVPRPQVFYTYEWALAVQRAYPATFRTLLCLAHDASNSLCGVAALATDAGGKCASFLCATTGDYCDFLSSPEFRPAFVLAVLKELRQRGIEEMVFTNLPADSPTVAAVQVTSNACGLRSFARSAYLCAQVSLSRGGDKDPVLPGKKMLRRRLNTMEREHPVELDHCRSWSTVEPVLAEFMQSHVARFLRNGRISNMMRPERRTFLVELAKLLAEQGWLVLTRMTSGDRVLAWNYGFQFRGTWFWYQPTFDMKFEKYSPGFCLLAKLVEEAAADPEFHTVDLGLGAEGYKDRFANQTRPTLWVSLTSSAAHHVRTIARYRVSEAIKKRPKAEKFIRSQLELYGSFRRRLRTAGITQTCLWAGKRLRGIVAGRGEVFFYELSGPEPKMPSQGDVSLVRIDLNLLAAATMQESDEDMLSYLIRCARRLKSDHKAEGLALADRNGRFVHFAWIRPFEGFYLSELKAVVPSPSSDSVILFDCRTPASLRGRGFYAQAVNLVAARMRKEGKRVWIFSAASNTSSVRGLERAGLRPSFAVVRYGFLGWQRVVQRNAAVVHPSASEGFSI